VVSVNLCKERLNAATFKISVLLILIKNLTFFIYGRPFYVIKYRSYKLLEMVWLFWPTPYNRKCT